MNLYIDEIVIETERLKNQIRLKMEYYVKRCSKAYLLF